MAERRILYLTALTASLVFFWAYREWVSWVLLMVILILPWLSLAISLPAMARMEIGIVCPDRVLREQQTVVSLVGTCKYPHPAVRGRMSIRESLTGKTLRRRSGECIPTEHCGSWALQVEKGRVYDYLGLFVHRIRRKQNAFVYVMPEPVPMTTPPDLTEYLATAFKPKPGGGYAENHELRLYRPGDNLHQIHWKLTAKTGKLILREPMDPIKGKAVVSLELNGDGALVDRKLGRLLWLCRYLLEENVPHEVHCLTADGKKVYLVASAQQVDAALRGILRQRLAASEEKIDFIAASWRYHIGGDNL